MTLIDTTDLTLIGPGSEWFWTMAQATALIITFVAIYRQLRAARSSNEFVEVREVEAEFQSARMTRMRLAMYQDLAGRDPAAGLPDAALDVLSWYDNLGYLVGSGHLNPRWFHRSWGHDIQIEWFLLQPFVAHERAADPDEADLHRSFEELARRMRAMDVKAGRPIVFDEETDRPRYIAGYTRLLRVRLGFAEPGPAAALTSAP